MSQLIPTFYKNVQTICITDNESNLIEYLSHDGLILLKQLYLTEINAALNPLPCRDFGLFLINLLSLCYSHVSNNDAERALYNLPTISSIFNPEITDQLHSETSLNIFEALDYIFDTIVRLFYLHSNPDNHTTNIPTSEIKNIHIEIARAFVNIPLPPLTTEYRTIWFYQKRIRSLLLIFKQIISLQPSSYTNNFASNPIGTVITTIHNYLSTETSHFLVQLGFDSLQAFALLIENTLGNVNQVPSMYRRVTSDLLNLVSQLLVGDYFALFILLNTDKENEFNAIQLLEHCSIIFKRLKIRRSVDSRRKQHRRLIKICWDNSYDQACTLHQHENSFEIVLNNRSTFEGDFEIRGNNEENNQTKRICGISAMYDKLIRLTIKQLDNDQPSFAFIHDCLSYLIFYGSCSCYSLSYYRTLLAKINHLKADENTVNSLEQQSIQLLRQAFLLLSNCSQHNHYHENQIADNTLFWTYLSNHLFQRSSHYSLKLIRSFPELIQCCSITDKQSAFRLCIIPSLEHYRNNVSAQTTSNIEIIECLIRTLPNLLFDIVIDTTFISLSDTLIALSSLFPTLLIHTLPVLGCLLTSTCDSLSIDISESFLQLIIRLTNAWSLSHDGIDNLCNILIILLQKSPTFRQAFYAHLCHLHLYEHFQLMLNNKSTIQSSIIASTLVSISYYTKSNDNRFNYKLVLEQIMLFSEKNRYNQSWFELLVRLSLSQQYQNRRTRWKSSTMQKNSSYNEPEDDSSSSSTRSLINYEVENAEDIDEDYYADIESLSEETPVETIAKQNQNMYSNLILFPELVIMGLETVWQNVDNDWSDQQSTTKSSIYVTNLVTYLELLSLLVRANSYNCMVLKKSHIDGYLFTCLTKIVPRSSFSQKDTLISLIITLLQFLWSQSITVNQLDQCFKLIITHPSLVGPLLRLFKHLVHQIDSNQPRSYCSMPSSSIVTSKSGNHLHLTLDQLLFLKYPQIENDSTTSSRSFSNVRQTAFVTEILKSVQIHFPLTIAIWLRVNNPFDKHEANDGNLNESEELNNDSRLILHILTLHHEGIQLQFWLDSKPNICLKIVQVTSATNSDLIDQYIRLSIVPRESWSHVFLTISKTTNTVAVCLNGQTSSTKTHPLPPLYSTNTAKPWSISLGQQSLDTCTSFYYDLGSILLFDKVDLLNGTTSNFVPTYLYSLGSDHWHFLTASQQQQSTASYWTYQRFTRVHSSISIDKFEIEQNACHTILKRSIIAAYSSSNPWTLFLFNPTPDSNDEATTSRLNKILTFRSSASVSTTSSSTTSNDDFLLTAATTISLPSKISLEQSSNILNICEQLGGILNFIYFFGKIIEINAYQSSASICHISDIIFSSIWKIKSYYDLFNSIDGYCLIVKILTTNECTRHISQEFYEVLVDKCVILNQQRLYDINLFRFLLLDWRIWCNHPKIFSLIFKLFNDLLSDQTHGKYFYVNRQLFKTYFKVGHLLTLCQEIIDEQEYITIDEPLTKFLVNIIEALIENDINTISSLMDFVLLIHPLVKTYVTYNKEHFYFVVKPFNYYKQREKYQQENLRKQKETSVSIASDEASDNSTIRKSHSFADIVSSSIEMDNETYVNRRPHYVTVADVTTTLAPSKTFPIEANTLGNKAFIHSIDRLSTGILRLLTNIALTTSDRLMMTLIDRVFRLNILIVLLLDASIAKRVQCIKLLDIILKRMDREKVQNDVIKANLHTMLANQIYYQLDGHTDEKLLLESCVSIALQRPIQLDVKSELSKQMPDADQYFFILSSSPPCPRSQVGFALVLSFIEKLSMTNHDLCQLLLDLLNTIILRSNDENRHFLVEIGLTHVLFNTLSSAISISHEKIISLVQKCYNSLIVTMFTTTINDDISFISIIEYIVGMMMNEDIDDSDCSKYNRRILHQTLSNMFNSIIDSIEKPPSIDISSHQSTTSRSSIDDHGLNPVLAENHDRFRKFLQLALDYIYSFHEECQCFEIFTLRLLDISLLGIAYLIEKRSNHLVPRHQMSLIIYRCGDVIKQIGQKLLTISLDPAKQRFFFRIKILKHIIDQPNVKGILDYLLMNDNQCYIYHQILLYVQILSKTIPKDSEFEQITNQSSSERSKVSSDSGHPIILKTTKINKVDSSGEQSSSHTIDMSTRTPNSSKQIKPASKRPIKPNEQFSSSDEEVERRVHSTVLSNSSTIIEEPETQMQKISDHSSSSPSLSLSSISSELTSVQHSSLINYQNVINSFRDLMGRINVQSLTNSDNTVTQKRIGLTNYLLALPSSTALQGIKNAVKETRVRHSIDIPVADSSEKTLPKKQWNTILGINHPGRRGSHGTASSAAPLNINWQKRTEEKRKEYTDAVNQSIEVTQKRFKSAHKSSLRTLTEVAISTVTTRAMEITQDIINLQNFERKEFLEHLRLIQSVDLRTKHLWHQLISQLTHEYGVWFEPLSYPKFWELDPTENPQRERRRLQRSFCLMEKRFFQPQIPDEVLVNAPLSYLFDSRHYQAVNIQTVLYRNEKIEYQCRCTNVTPNNEVKGELLVGATRIYFVAEDQLSASTKAKSTNSAVTSVGYNHHSFNDDSNSFSFAIDDIGEMYKRRYLLMDLALELFFINGITLMIAHVERNDRDNLYRLLAKRNVSHAKPEDKVTEIHNLWKQGYVTNFDYLMQLNKLAGRTFLDLMQYPVYPYVISNYDVGVLDLRAAANYRNLAKPIAIQHIDKEEKFVDVYNALQDAQDLELLRQQENEQQEQQLVAIFGHQSDPYHFASLYSNSGIVLHYLVRLLPYTRMFLDYQDNNFDCADRTYHDVKTSYWLSSFESTSDFKEIIPEFYYLYEFLLNKQGFNFGKRQNGEQVSDVTLPNWCKQNARLYVNGLRQALESDYVTAHLHEWVDLIFGYKQAGKAAVDSINVYHAACYYGFPIENISDQVTKKAYYGIIRTYGQVPKQLFPHAHPAYSAGSSTSTSNSSDKRNSERGVFESKLPVDSIHRQITGVQWGDFVGSYDMPSPDYVNSYDCPVVVSSFVVRNSGACIICLPSSSLIVYKEYIVNESTGEQMNASPSSLSTPQVDTMIALKWNTPDGIVRCRQLKQIKTWYNFLVPIDDQDKITCCTSIDYRLLFMGKKSGLIEIYKIDRNKNVTAGIELCQRYLPFIAHRSPITCLHVNRQFSLLISASADGMLTLWDTNRLSYVRTYRQDNQTIYHLTSSDTTGDISYLSSSGSQWHLSYLTCNCDLIGCLTFSEQLNCLCFTSASEGTSVNVLLGGFENGRILMWSTWDLTLLRQLDFPQLRLRPIIAICVSKGDRRRLYVSDRDRHLHTIESRLSSSTSASPAPQILFLS